MTGSFIRASPILTKPSISAVVNDHTSGWEGGDDAGEGVHRFCHGCGIRYFLLEDRLRSVENCGFSISSERVTSLRREYTSVSWFCSPLR